jgi:hypothetical protein
LPYKIFKEKNIKKFKKTLKPLLVLGYLLPYSSDLKMVGPLASEWPNYQSSFTILLKIGI